MFYHIIFRKKAKITPIITVFGISIGYFALRFRILQSALLSFEGFTGLSARIPGFFVSIGNYLRLLFFPVGLHIDYGNKLFSLFSAQKRGFVKNF